MTSGWSIVTRLPLREITWICLVGLFPNVDSKIAPRFGTRRTVSFDWLQEVVHLVARSLIQRPDSTFLPDRIASEFTRKSKGEVT